MTWTKVNTSPPHGLGLHLISLILSPERNFMKHRKTHVFYVSMKHRS